MNHDTTTEVEGDLAKLIAVRRAAADGTVRAWRLDVGASLAEVGREILVSKGTLSKWERGLAVPSRSAGLRLGAVMAKHSEGL